MKIFSATESSGYKTKLLINGGDASQVRFPRVDEVHSPAIQLNIAAVGLIHARHNFDHGRFASAIFADERMHLATPHLEVRLLQRLHTREIFVDVPASAAAGRSCAPRSQSHIWLH